MLMVIAAVRSHNHDQAFSLYFETKIYVYDMEWLDNLQTTISADNSSRSVLNKYCRVNKT